MKKVFIFVLICLVLPVCVFAGEGHEECALCHGVHSSKGPVIFVGTVKTIINPNTGQPIKERDALCMFCHAEEPVGLGYRPIELEESHPTSIPPDKVILPPEAQKEKDDDLTYMGCHDPHPSNRNYMYLRTDVDSPSAFCVWCHSDKGAKE